MNNKNLKFGVDVRNEIAEGVRKLSSAVKVTLGPRGKNVIIEGPEGCLPIITKDGITCAESIKLSNRIENLGAQMVKSVAGNTNIAAGDGTTTSVVLAERIYTEGLKNVVAGSNPTYIKRGIDIGVSLVVDKLKEMSSPIQTKEDIEHVATISSNGDTSVGALLAEAMDKVGIDGTINVERGHSMDTSLTVVEGMQFDRGYLSSHFITNKGTSDVEFDNPYILLYENEIQNMQTLLPFLQRAAKACKSEGRPLLIIAKDVAAEVLSTIIINKLRGTLPVCAIKAPDFGNNQKAMMEDLSILTGGTLVGDTLGKKIENVELDDLGSAKRVIISKDSTTIIGGNGSSVSIADRVAHLKKLTVDGTYDNVFLRKRISKLSGGVALISVGGGSEAEVIEKYHRVEDALNATRSAVEEGIVAGGGSALIHALSALDAINLDNDEQIGVNILKRALKAPLEQIVNNSGENNGAVVIDKVLTLGYPHGYDALNNKYTNMLEAGIIDPVKVTRCALQNAASISGLLLTTECSITE